jgi:hypothetical protein
MKPEEPEKFLKIHVENENWEILLRIIPIKLIKS